MKITNVLSTDATPVPKELTAREAARALLDSQSGVLWVMDEDVALGVIHHACMTKAIAEGVDAAKATVEQVMDDAIITVRPEQDAHDARQLMHDSDVSHALVRDASGALLGTVALRDLDIRFHHEGGRIFGFGPA